MFRLTLSLSLIALALVAPVPALAQWTASTQLDEMSGKPWRIQSVRSSNSLKFDAPYRGANIATLTVRQHSTNGTDVIFGIERGQIVNDVVTVKFDDDDPVQFRYSGASDGSRNVIFLSEKAKFIDRARSASRVLVEFTAYANGESIARFSTPGGLPAEILVPSNPFRGPSGGYGGKVAAAIRPNVVFPDADAVDGNPGAEFDLRLDPTGEIQGTPVLVKSSGIASWDAAALRAIEKTQKLPRDIDGTVPPRLIVTLRPKR